MPRWADQRDKIKVTIRLFYGDKERLQRYYPSVPFNEVIRKLLKAHLDVLEKKAEARKAHRAVLPEVELGPSVVFAAGEKAGRDDREE